MSKVRSRINTSTRAFIRPQKDSKPFCNQHKTWNRGTCKQGTKACFNCGQMVHLAKDFTKALIAFVNQETPNTISNKPLTR